MGTNYYIKTAFKEYSRGKHIGKRSAAGLYCWDCGITLHRGGNKRIHYGCEHIGLTMCDCQWNKVCPRCGKRLVKETFENGAAGRELGFNKSVPKKKTGVASCSSFNWAIPEVELIKICKRKIIRKSIINEYGDIFSLKGFQNILKECPIQYTNMIGEDFS